MRGTTALEYGLILAVFAVALIMSLGQLAGVTTGILGNIGASINAAR